mgnify:CR=1 FL=1
MCSSDLLTGLAPAGSGIPLGGGSYCIVDPAPEYWGIFTSMFLHGGWMHLLGNMWFLWLFGNNIEDSMTRPRFVVFYLLCGIAAALLQVWSGPDSPVPMVGASGAISGVMGAYLVLFPRVKVYTLIPLGFFTTTYALPAWVMLLYWAGLQLLGGFGAGEGGVAFWAHVGGFLAGIVLVKLFARPDHAFTFDCAGACASVFADEQLIRHILTNMLTNAVKYSPKGGPIRVILRC